MPSAAVFVTMAVTVELLSGEEGRRDTGMVPCPSGLSSLRKISQYLPLFRTHRWIKHNFKLYLNLTFESIITQRIQRSKHAYIYNHLAEYVIRPHNGRTSRNGYGFWEVFLADTINQSRALKGYNRSLEQQYFFFFLVSTLGSAICIGRFQRLWRWRRPPRFRVIVRCLSWGRHLTLPSPHRSSATRRSFSSHRRQDQLRSPRRQLIHSPTHY